MKVHNAFTAHIIPLHCMIGQTAIRLLCTTYHYDVNLSLATPGTDFAASGAWEVQRIIAGAAG